MRLGDTINVNCTDTGKTQPGLVHRLGKDYLEVLLGPETKRVRVVLKRKPNTKLFVGNLVGMEFTVQT